MFSFSDLFYDFVICLSDVYSKVIKYVMKNFFDKEQNIILVIIIVMIFNEKKNDF